MLKFDRGGSGSPKLVGGGVPPHYARPRLFEYRMDADQFVRDMPFDGSSRVEVRHYSRLPNALKEQIFEAYRDLLQVAA